MLKLDIVLEENFDEENRRFIPAKVFSLELEHSLASLSKWEQREEKPFLSKESKTPEETLRYVQDMTLTSNVPDTVYAYMSEANAKAVDQYINAKMTATWFNEKEPQRPSREIVTAEVIYFWMVSMQIPFECQYWHLNRLITLIRVCNEKNKQSQPKTNRRSAAEQRRLLNQQRRQQFGTTG